MKMTVSEKSGVRNGNELNEKTIEQKFAKAIKAKKGTFGKRSEPNDLRK